MAGSRARSVVLAALLCVAATLAIPQSTAASEASASYAGRAKGAEVTVLGSQRAFSDTGALPSSGGVRESSAVNERIAGVGSAKVLHASAIGAGSNARSEASLADLQVIAGGQSIAANFAMARSSATCGDYGDFTTVDSEVSGLRVNGERVVVSGSPNQTISLGGAGRIVVNEQTYTGEEAVINAIHIETFSVDIVIASASSDITCYFLPPPDDDDDDLPIPCPGVDFVTGGGWTKGTPSGSKANFGFAGGVDEDGNLTGHLDFHEHGSKMKVKSTSVTRYATVDENTRHIEGTADIDGTAGFYLLDVSDNGEPGRHDTFSMKLSNGYSVSGYIGGGNIQLHLGCD